MMPSRDIQIKEEVLRALRWNPSIGVMVENGTVTLTGNVDSYAVRLLAQEATQFIEGVFNVRNNIAVNGSNVSWSDMEISVAARKALEWDALIPSERIKVTVSNGWVALEGEVDLLREREDAERIVRRLTGVRGVYNQMTINPSVTRAENVRLAIEEELKARARLEAERIQVSLKDGTVTLSGKVQSWEEERAITTAAGRAPGVRHVKDHLRIEG